MSRSWCAHRDPAITRSRLGNHTLMAIGHDRVMFQQFGEIKKITAKVRDNTLTHDPVMNRVTERIMPKSWPDHDRVMTQSWRDHDRDHELIQLLSQSLEIWNSGFDGRVRAREHGCNMVCLYCCNIVCLHRSKARRLMATGEHMDPSWSLTRHKIQAYTCVSTSTLKWNACLLLFPYACSNSWVPTPNAKNALWCCHIISLMNVNLKFEDKLQEWSGHLRKLGMWCWCFSWSW